MKVSGHWAVFPGVRSLTRAFPSPPLTESFDDFRVVANHPLDGVALDGTASRREREGPPALMITQQVLQQAAEGGRVPGWCQHAGFAQELGRPAAARRQHRPPARE